LTSDRKDGIMCKGDIIEYSWMVCIEEAGIVGVERRGAEEGKKKKGKERRWKEKREKKLEKRKESGAKED
jgi:hypothetical protein